MHVFMQSLADAWLRLQDSLLAWFIGLVAAASHEHQRVVQRYRQLDVPKMSRAFVACEPAGGTPAQTHKSCVLSTHAPHCAPTNAKAAAITHAGSAPRLKHRAAQDDKVNVAELPRRSNITVQQAKHRSNS